MNRMNSRCHGDNTVHVYIVIGKYIITRTPPVEAPSRGHTCYLFTVSNSGLLSVQRQPVDHAHRHRHTPELACGFNSSIGYY